jgi:hypothetical protein
MTPESPPQTDPIGVGPAEGSADRPPSTCPVKSPWIRRLGVAGFLFFFIKGLAWLIVPTILAWWAAKN